MLLFITLALVTVSHILLPYLFKGEESAMHSAVSTTLDVFSWVILWKPIDRLIYYWNPFLKDIALFEKLEKGEVILTEIED